MICWQKYLSLCKYSKLLHGYKFQNKLYLRRKNQQLHNSRQKPKLTLKYQEEEQSLLASDYSAWCCQDTAKTEISALSMTFSNSDAETVNFILFPFLSQIMKQRELSRGIMVEFERSPLEQWLCKDLNINQCIAMQCMTHFCLQYLFFQMLIV